jgi:hypothetical protein
VPSKLSPLTQTLLFLGGAALGFLLQFAIAKNHVSRSLDAIHYVAIAAFFLSALSLLWEKFRKQELSPLPFAGLHLAFGWLFGVVWVVRLSGR